MDFSRTKSLPPPPSVLGALKVGFDAVASRAMIILLPVAFDLLVWLGPRLRLDVLMQPVLQAFPLASAGRFTPTQVEMVRGFYTHIFGHWNLFSLARTFPVGISSLMAWLNAGQVFSWRPDGFVTAPVMLNTPLGEAFVVQAPSMFGLLIWLAVLIVGGWMLGGLYYYYTSQLIVSGNDVVVGKLPGAIMQTVLLSIIWVLVFGVVGIPAATLIAVSSLFGEVVSNIVFLFMGMMAVWLLIPFFFSAHGIFIRGQNAISSILAGFQFVRFTAPTSGLFALMVVAISQGLNLLWSVPEQDSWMFMVGVAGHAFMTTSLLAASFVYYRDMSVWLQTALDQIRKQTAVL